MLIALIAATQIAYSFPVGVHRTYDIVVSFDGYLPIFGGKEAKAELTMVVDVVGAPPTDKGEARATSEIKELKLVFNGAAMPFNANNIRAYFPKTTIALDPQGKVLQTDAPNATFPFRLPGLDVKKFPDITYLPLEFPAAGIDLNTAWKFTKKFNGSDMNYAVTPTAIDEKAVAMTLTLGQAYTTLEDEQGSVTEDETLATTKVESKLEGEGQATFDRSLNLVTKFKGKGTTTSRATVIKTGETSDRKLITIITATLRTEKQSQLTH